MNGPVFAVTNDELMPGRIAGASSRGELALAPFAIGKMKGCSWTRRSTEERCGRPCHYAALPWRTSDGTAPISTAQRAL